MNYILTMGELKTLAGLLGAQHFFSLEEQETTLQREDVIQNVFRLHQRGFLTQTDNGFCCEPEIKRLIQVIVDADRAIVLRSPEEAYLCCYLAGDECTVVEMIAERPMEYKLYSQPLSELCLQLCPMEDLQAMQEYEFDFSQLHFDVIPEETNLRLQADIYSITEQCQIARALIVQTQLGKVQAFHADGEMSVNAYRVQEFYRWIVGQIGGKEL
ncbi:MAG: hypothetical protein E7434_01945 [Ruminococcaceae bacterium]|nr:hypothetical protein [Oscillospiraceae bacterium]